MNRRQHWTRVREGSRRAAWRGAGEARIPMTRSLPPCDPQHTDSNIQHTATHWLHDGAKWTSCAAAGEDGVIRARESAHGKRRLRAAAVGQAARACKARTSTTGHRDGGLRRGREAFDALMSVAHEDLRGHRRSSRGGSGLDGRSSGAIKPRIISCENRVLNSVGGCVGSRCTVHTKRGVHVRMLALVPDGCIESDSYFHPD